jgi:hypothetical protein
MKLPAKSYKELTVGPRQGKQVEARVFTALVPENKCVGSPITKAKANNDLDTGSEKRSG